MIGKRMEKYAFNSEARELLIQEIIESRSSHNSNNSLRFEYEYRGEKYSMGPMF